MNLKTFDPLFHVLNLAVTTITNFPGSTYGEIKDGVETICVELGIEIIKIAINVYQNIVYVTTEVEDAVKLIERTNTKYQRSILKSSFEPFSEKHPIPFQYVNSKIDKAIREGLRRIKVSNFDHDTKQIVRSVLNQLMKENGIQSLGIIFSNNNTIANIHIEKKNADKLYNLIENSKLNDFVTCSVLKVEDSFIPPGWFKEQLLKEASNSKVPENPKECLDESFDDEVILEINSEDFLIDGPVLEINNEVFLRGHSTVSS